MYRVYQSDRQNGPHYAESANSRYAASCAGATVQAAKIRKGLCSAGVARRIDVTTCGHATLIEKPTAVKCAGMKARVAACTLLAVVSFANRRSADLVTEIADADHDVAYSLLLAC